LRKTCSARPRADHAPTSSSVTKRAARLHLADQLVERRRVGAYGGEAGADVPARVLEVDVADLSVDQDVVDAADAQGERERLADGRAGRGAEAHAAAAQVDRARRGARLAVVGDQLEADGVAGGLAPLVRGQAPDGVEDLARGGGLDQD